MLSLGFTLIFAVVISLVRFRRIAPAFHPFIFMIWIAMLNEIVSTVVVIQGMSNAVNTNIYLLFESLLLVWFFQKQRVFDQSPRLPYILAVVYIITWSAENLVISRLWLFESYYTVFYSFITVLCSINLINRVLLTSTSRLHADPLFIIALAFIIYHTYSLVVEVFWIYGLDASRDFRIYVYDILICINVVINLVYALAVLWMPARQKFTLL